MLLILFIAMAAAPFESFAGSITLYGKEMTAVLSDTTGQVISISDAVGARVLVGSEDRYDLDGKTSTEADDSVLSRKVDKNRVSFECLNRKLGIKTSKQYRLAGQVLEKETKYLTGNKDKLLFKLSSHSTLDPDLYKDGDYYLPTDDGWKVFGVPFTAGSSIKEPKAWTFSTGSFIYYFPGSDRVFTHYRYKVNGRYFYCDAHPSVESKLVPGGAITAIGLGFINDQTGLNLETRYALIGGDPFDYHRFIYSQPPYSDYRGRKVSTWFPKGRMFISDPGAGMVGLMKNRDGVLKDVADFMKLLKDDEYLLVFFNHWTVQGDFPYQGTFRYYTYTDTGYSQPVPIEELKENIRMLKAISPRIKVGGYATFTPTAGTPPYDDHKDWMLYDQEGKIQFGGDGTGLGGVPDFSSGYREYLLNQLSHYITDLGFDWIHIDSGVSEGINWKTKNVVQSYENAKFYDELGKIFEKNDAAIIQNVSGTDALWSHGSYMECQQPDRWEKKDWRTLAVPGSLGILYRTNRPGVWVNLCYGTRGIYGIRNGQTGMRGWIRNATNWWRDVSHSLAHEKVIDEMLEMTASDVSVYPSWWKLQTDKLEIEPMDKGEALVIPALLHGDTGGDQKISLNTADLKYKKGNYLFTFDSLLSSTEMVDVFKPIPWKVDYLRTISFGVVKNPPAKYTHTMEMEPLHNYYHTITQVPGWVYTFNGERTSFLLPENKGVKITGFLPADAPFYNLSVQNSNNTAQVLAYVPQDWKGVKTEINGRQAKVALTEILNNKFILLDLTKGKSAVRISDAKPNFAELPKAAYANPGSDYWTETSHRLFYHNLDHRAYQEDGKSCLALKEISPGGGSIDAYMTQKEEAGGFSIKVKGEKSGGKAIVRLAAGDNWTYEIKDAFAGWKEFNVYKDQMTPSTTVKKWDATTYMGLIFYPAGGKEMNIADIHLLSAREGDIVKIKELKRKLTVCRTKTPPVIDGYGNDACWKNCEVATDFFLYGKDALAGSKALVRLCYDDDNLYMLFDNLEPIINLEDAKVPEAKVWLSDHCHIFIDPYRDMTNYYEIGIDTAGTVADIKNSETGWDMKWNGEYEVKTGLNYNVGWMCEMKLPFNNFGKKPKPGDIWGVTFMRADITGEASVWTNGAWNDPAGFGDMVFSGEVK
ncbi:MAG: sugar-binding protein [Candidatus Omnitrophota bacterium]